jgi:hypothetical protein
VTDNIYEEQKRIVLARLRTLSSGAKLMSGGQSLSVKEMIEHVEKDDQVGRDIVKAQMKMFQVLTSV